MVTPSSTKPSRPQLRSIRLHPVKSTAIRPVASAVLEPWGLAGDRRWMVVDATGECVTARELPALFTLSADTPETRSELPGPLRLSAPGHPSIDVALPVGEPIDLSVHGRGLGGILADAESTHWVRSVLGRPDVRLAYAVRPRPLNPAYAEPGDATACADAYPVTLASAASLRQLAEWIATGARGRGEEPADVTMDRFRPNLVIDGDLEPFAEDGWSHITIGAVTLRVVKGIERCAMTLRDPQTLESQAEPIRTLARHRKWEGATWFGRQLIPDTLGTIRVGDPVTTWPGG